MEGATKLEAEAKAQREARAAKAEAALAEERKAAQAKADERDADDAFLLDWSVDKPPVRQADLVRRALARWEAGRPR